MMRRGVVFALCVLAGAAAQAQQVTFQNAARFALNHGSTSDATSLMALEDVGSLAGPEDGFLDIITAGQDSRISLLYGRRDGRFVSGVISPLGRIPTGLAVARADGDHIKDLLITDAGSQLTCYRGFDDGFTPYTLGGGPFPVLRNPVGLEVADLNGDGRIDVAVVSEGDQAAGGITILHGNGDCTFSAPSPPADSQIAAGLASSAVTIADFNRDGRLDIAVANGLSNDVTILRRDASGRYMVTQTLVADDEPTAIGSADLNGDGHVDLVVTNRNSDSVSVFLGRGGGTFAAAASFTAGSSGSSPGGMSIADLNLDGIPDVVVANNRSSDASVLLGDGLGNLLPPRVFVADEEPLASRVGLLNDDAVPDVVVVSRGRQVPNATVLRGLGDGTLAGVEDVVTRPNPNGLAVGDLDNNGLADIAVPHSDGHVLLFHGTGEGFAPAPPLVTGLDINDVVPGDFDGNGLLDLVNVNNNRSQLTLFRAIPGGRFAAGVAVAIGGAAITGLAVDLNGDNFTDLAVVRRTGEAADAVDVLLADGRGGFRTPVSYGAGQTSIDIDFGDCNNDGNVDLYVVNNGSASISLLVGTGGGGLRPMPPRLVDGAPKAIAVADFDRDGFDDFALAMAMSSSVVIYYGNGTCMFTPGQDRLIGGGSPAGLAARDFSGDGIPDLLVSDEVANAATLFTKFPGGRLFQRLAGDEFGVSRRPIAAAAGDFDGDGRYDGATANSFVAGSVSVLTNILAPAVTRGDGNRDARLTAADLTAVMREVGDGGSPRVEEAARAGFSAGPGVDANGDGLVTLQDAMGVASRIFGL